MKLLILVLCTILSFNIMAGTKVMMKTSMGDITIELNDKEAPLTTKNFISYVKSGHYDGLIFHRVIQNFMIQGGGLKPDMSKAETKDPIKNEANNGLSNARGTISMARTGDPHSATAQFFINVVDNARLDYQSENNYGYCVFGKVTSGMETVDKIRNVTTTSRAGHGDVPTDIILIKSVTLL